MKALRFFILSVAFFLSFSLLAEAAEKLGKFDIDDITLRPRMYVQEEQNSGFGLGESSIGFYWKKDETLSTHWRIGPRFLLNTPAFFGDADTSAKDVATLEAYGEWAGVYGKLRLGLLPVDFGIEGRKKESELLFPRSFIFEERWVNLRDVGINYEIENNGYYTELTIHNGEGLDNPDQRVFVTSRWGWTDFENLDVGFSAHTGTTKPESTSLAKTHLAAFDKDEKSLLRILDLYGDWHPHGWKLAFEVQAGELEQQEEKTPFKMGYIDLGHRQSDFFSFTFRYEHYDPNYHADDDLKKRISLAFEFSDRLGNSSLILLARKNLEESSELHRELHNDELMLIWRILPTVRD